MLNNAELDTLDVELDGEELLGELKPNRGYARQVLIYLIDPFPGRPRQ